MKFEQVSSCPDAMLPTRATMGAAGYDFYTYGHITIDPHSIGLVPTGIKAQIDDGYYLQLALRSSTPKKKGLMLANSIGIIDQDYYNNEANEGAIMFQVYNFTDNLVEIEHGERIGQGIFIKYYKTDNDVTSGIRVGGFGSTSYADRSTNDHMSSKEDPKTGDFQND